MKQVTSRQIKKLHPTLKKCKCGFIGPRRRFYQHLDVFKDYYVGKITEFYSKHGELPLNEDEGEKFQNAKWLKGTPKGYND